MATTTKRTGDRATTTATDYAGLFYDHDAEWALLGAMMVAPDRVPWFDVTPEDFSRPALGTLFGALVERLRDGAGKTDLVVAGDLVRSLQLDVRLADLADAADTAAVAPADVVRILHKCRQRRDAYTAATMIGRAVRDPGWDVSTELPRMLDHLLRLAAGREGDGGSFELRGTAEAEVLAIAKALREPEELAAKETVATGFHAFDRVLGGGFPRGEMTVLGGFPGMGKTAFAQQIAEQAAGLGAIVLVCSAEMSRKALARRALSRHSGVNLRKIRTREVTDGELVKLGVAAESLPTVYGTDVASMTSTDVGAAVRRLKLRCGRVDLVIVDYLQLLRDLAQRGEQGWERIGRIAENLLAIAKETGAAIVALSQLTHHEQGTGKRKDMRPTSRDIRGSGNIEQAADTIVMLHREGYYDRNLTGYRREMVELLIRKNRNGPTGTEFLRWSESTTSFEEATEEAVEAYSYRG